MTEDPDWLKPGDIVTVEAYGGRWRVQEADDAECVLTGVSLPDMDQTRRIPTDHILKPCPPAASLL